MSEQDSWPNGCTKHGLIVPYEYEELPGHPGKTNQFCPRCRQEQKMAAILCGSTAPSWKPPEDLFELQIKAARATRRGMLIPAVSRCVNACWETLTVFDGENEPRVRELLRQEIDKLVEEAIK